MGGGGSVVQVLRSAFGSICTSEEVGLVQASKRVK